MLQCRMQYVYHLIPKNFVGNVLFPLNRLKDSLPETYLSQAAKYAGREKMLERQIPKLNCLWNDVLHCSSLNPRILFEHLESIGLGSYSGTKWYKIPCSVLENVPVAIYRAPAEPRKNLTLVDGDIELFNLMSWEEPSSLSVQAIDYFAKCKSEKTTLFAFQFIPHVLIKAQIDVTRLEIETYV